MTMIFYKSILYQTVKILTDKEFIAFCDSYFNTDLIEKPKHLGDYYESEKLDTRRRNYSI